MSEKNFRTAEAGKDFQRLDNGVLVVRRQFDNLLAPYQEEQIPDVLGAVDHGLRISSTKVYEKLLAKEQLEFNALVRILEDAGLSVIFAFQGWNGAGKSGAITRLVDATGHDPKIIKWIPIGPPTDDDKKHDHLWRFYDNDRMPRVGQVSCFDRSWFERLMIEKVEELTDGKKIRRSYEEIRSFQQGLSSRGAIMINIWMDVTQKKQLKRLEKRLKTNPWKWNPADMEERKHVAEYRDAINEMFFRTGTQYAAWHIISSESKKYSRVTVPQVANQVIIERLRDELGEPELVKRLVELLGQIMSAKRLIKVMRRLLGRIMTQEKITESLTEKRLREVLGDKLLRKILDGKKLEDVIAEIDKEEREKRERQRERDKLRCQKQTAESLENDKLRQVLGEELVGMIASGTKLKKVAAKLKKRAKQEKKRRKEEAKGN